MATTEFTFSPYMDVFCCLVESPHLYLYMPLLSGWGNEDKQNTASLNKPYYDTNTALFTSFTLSMHTFDISHWLSQHRDVAGECRRNAWVIKWDI